MRKPRQKSIEIRNYILDNVTSHPKDISVVTLNRFNISRPAVLGHINKLIDDGLLEAKGTTRARHYKLKLLTDDEFSFDLSPDTEEDKVWRHLARPLLSGIQDNVMRICEYGMNEMINNAIEHSEGTQGRIHVQLTAANISFILHDNGIGIFKKIQREIPRISEPRQAILELSKGKLTTDPSRHTGEGIFFVSRMFDRFIIFSDGLYYSPNILRDQEIRKFQESFEGTGVEMSISTRSEKTMKDVFDRYTSDEDDDYAFSKTDVPVSLARFGSDHLVSRSQARRLLNRLHDFKHIMLDFGGINSIGQAFADEIFRVFDRNNPDIVISHLNINADIDRMIRRVKSKGL